MANKTRLTSGYISNKKIKPVPNGYDPLEVDSLLDIIVSDYTQFENGVLLTKEKYQELLNKIKRLEKEYEELVLTLKKEKHKNDLLSASNAQLDNFDLLIRIGKLETIIEKKLHMSKKEIENFDPDDC